MLAKSAAIHQAKIRRAAPKPLAFVVPPAAAQRRPVKPNGVQPACIEGLEGRSLASDHVTRLVNDFVEAVARRDEAAERWRESEARQAENGGEFDSPNSLESEVAYWKTACELVGRMVPLLEKELAAAVRLLFHSEETADELYAHGAFDGPICWSMGTCQIVVMEDGHGISRVILAHELDSDSSSGFPGEVGSARTLRLTSEVE